MGRRIQFNIDKKMKTQDSRDERKDTEYDGNASRMRVIFQGGPNASRKSFFLCVQLTERIENGFQICYI